MVARRWRWDEEIYKQEEETKRELWKITKRSLYIIHDSTEQ